MTGLDIKVKYTCYVVLLVMGTDRTRIRQGTTKTNNIYSIPKMHAPLQTWLTLSKIPIIIEFRSMFSILLATILKKPN